MPLGLAWALTLALTACGGGGGGGSTATTSAADSPSGAAAAVLGLSSFSPPSAVEGSTVTVQGTALDRVQQVWLGAQQASQVQLDSSTQLRFVVPSGAASAALRLVSAQGEASSTGTLTVLPAPVVQSLSPAQARVGDMLSLTGTALDSIGQVVVGTVAVAPVNRSSTSVQVAVPSLAANGTLSLRLVDGSSRALAQSFTLLPPLSIVTGMAPTSVREGSTVTLTGSYLDNATQVLVAGSAVTPISQSASSLSFAAPAREGLVELLMVDGARVSAGTLSLLTAPRVSIASVEVAQSYSQLVRGSYQSLVPNKAAWLRVFVVGDSAMAAPAVTATVSTCPALGTLTLSGPSQLPTTAPARTSLEQTFTTAIPASCVQSGMLADVRVANSNPRNSGAAASAQPAVSGNTSLNLVLVPLVTNGSTGQVPDSAMVQRMLTRIFPLDAARITISVRAPYTLSTTQVTDSSGWQNALVELRQLWQAEGAGRHYYGLVPNPSFARGISGLGYVNTSSSSPWLAAIGLDAVALDPRYFGTDASLYNMAHELGHNWSLGHSACGVTGAVDSVPSDSSYANAGLGPNPVFESDSNRDGITGPLAVYSPAAPNNHDLMSYCDAQWFSDYNYSRLQQFLASYIYPRVTGYASERTLLDFHGQIGADQSVLIAPPAARSTRQPYTGSGAYTLRLRTAQGQVLDTPFEAIAVADGSAATQHFHASVPDPGAIDSVEVLHQGRSLAVQLDAPTPAIKTWATGVEAKETPSVQWQESAGQLLLRWDASRYPVLQVRHQGTDRTTLLATRLRGGSASVDLGAVPGGGEWEFSLSSGWNAQLVRAPRTP
ncbi:MAG: IPT/TIG domain-containing protein [Rhodoferax sp.]